MKRRDFIRSASIATAGLALGKKGQLLARSKKASEWRTFEVTTNIEVLKPAGTTRVWVPTPLVGDTPFGGGAPYQRTLGNTFDAGKGSARLVQRAPDALGLVAAEFPEGTKPVLTVTSRIATREHAVDLTAPRGASLETREDLEHFLRPTKLLPTDGIVKSTAAEITSGARSDLDKARAIYEWIVDNTARNPKTRGCGLGDIRFMLETKDLTGKCADLNALFVGLARASGLPARDVYGIRVTKSQLGYTSLGPATSRITKSQHCRAEVHLEQYGWVPVDPADVRKVVLEEPPGNRPLDDELVKQTRTRLFGSWEMNWIAYNFAHDVELPGSSGQPIGFLMYPQAETAAGRIDCLDPDGFKYEITAVEVVNGG